MCLKFWKNWLLDQFNSGFISMREHQPMERCGRMVSVRLGRCGSKERCAQHRLVDGRPWELEQWLARWLVLSGSQFCFGGSQQLGCAQHDSIHGILEHNRRPMEDHHRYHLGQQRQRQRGQTTPTDFFENRTKFYQLFKLQLTFCKY